MPSRRLRRARNCHRKESCQPLLAKSFFETITAKEALLKREHGFAVCLAMAGLGFPVPVFGQSAPTNLEFEVATVRQNKSGPPERPRIPGDGQGTLLPSGQFIMRNQLLKTLLGFAFNPNNQRFGDDLIVGVPAWVKSDRFDVVGKAPAGTP